MPETERFTNIVFGGGTGGKIIAWTLAEEGQRTAEVERRWIGGSCHNIACMPSKNVVHSAKVASLFGRGAEFGIECGAYSVNMERVRERKRKMVDADVKEHLAKYKETGTDLILGEGRMVGRRTLEVKTRDGSTRLLTADRLFLNLGTHATIPDTPGLAAARPMTHIEALELDRVPSHLLIVGGGYVGLEFAQAMRRFGSQVTVIEKGPQLLSREDQDAGDALLELFRDEGIEVLLRAQVRKVSGVSGESVRVQIGHEARERTIDATHILVAAGRTPNTTGIGLEDAGIQLDERGYIKVNDRLETTEPGVWALGECAGSPQFTHVSYDDALVILSNLKGDSRTTRDRLIPFCIFTDPELARVGLSETEARQRGIEYRVARMPAEGVFRARTISETRGFLKMLIDERGNRILGFTAFVTGGGDLIAVVQTAMLSGMEFPALRDAIFTHPTMPEGLNLLLSNVEVRQPEMLRMPARS
jgi:pyruvate/2-oxoglutarate dehydrogenase complex dihydrolipoamide dehydrogenase (E3) component